MDPFNRMNDTLRGFMTATIEAQEKISELSKLLITLQSNIQKELNFMYQNSDPHPIAYIEAKSEPNIYTQETKILPKSVKRKSEIPLQRNSKKSSSPMESQESTDFDKPSQIVFESQPLIFSKSKSQTSHPPLFSHPKSFKNPFSFISATSQVFDKMPCGLIVNDDCFMTADREGIVKFWDFHSLSKNQVTESKYINLREKLRYGDQFCIINNIGGRDYLLAIAPKGNIIKVGEPAYFQSSLISIPNARYQDPKISDIMIDLPDEVQCIIGGERLPYCSSIITASKQKNVVLQTISGNLKVAKRHPLHQCHTSTINSMLGSSDKVFSAGSDNRIVIYDLSKEMIICNVKNPPKARPINQIEFMPSSTNLIVRFSDNENQLGFFDSRLNSVVAQFGFSSHNALSSNTNFAISKSYCFLSDSNGYMHTFDIRNLQSEVPTFANDFGQKRIDQIGVYQDTLITLGLDRTIKLNKINNF
eukprot:NODE_470_length_7042_cov_0.535935.p2 type:complete len:475 gc:universal NODE_470_length_7042_cov_0.535935:1183-2607(+)